MITTIAQNQLTIAIFLLVMFSSLLFYINTKITCSSVYVNSRYTISAPGACTHDHCTRARAGMGNMKMTPFSKSFLATNVESGPGDGALSNVKSGDRLYIVGHGAPRGTSLAFKVRVG